MRLAPPPKLLFVALAIAMVLSYFGSWHFMFDNLSSFRVHFAVLFLLCCAGFLAGRQWSWFGLASVGLLASLAAIVPWYLPGQTESTGGDGLRLKLMVSNVSPRLEDPTRLLELIDKEQPDVLGLIELTPALHAGLSSLEDMYSYRFEAPADGFWGLALYSRYPLSGARLVHFGDDVPPAIVADLHTDDGQAEVILVHPFPPMTGEFTGLRNVQLGQLATYVSQSRRPTVVLGDLNIAMWSPYYAEFIAKSRLNNARQGYGVAATWPPSRLLGVPIDHVLHTNDISSDQFRVLKRIGSDHLPIAAQISLSTVNAVARSDTRVAEGEGVH